MSLLEQLIAVGVGVTQARQFAGPLKAAMALHGISTPAQVAGFLAQAIFESDSFTDLEENLYYTSPERIVKVFPSRVPTIESAKLLVRNPQALANRVYSGRGGNGNELSGDGWKFRGRGLFQLTFYKNYLRAGVGCGVTNQWTLTPEDVADPTGACLSAAFYWWDTGCNTYMDAMVFDETTKAINSAMLHAAERRALFYKVSQVMK